MSDLPMTTAVLPLSGIPVVLINSIIPFGVHGLKYGVPPFSIIGQHCNGQTHRHLYR